MMTAMKDERSDISRGGLEEGKKGETTGGLGLNVRMPQWRGMFGEGMEW